MLQIRQEQWDSFAAQSLARYQQSLVTELRRAWPEAWDELGADGFGAQVRSGVERAQTLGIVLEYDATRFVNLGFLFPDFEHDPGCAWIQDLLAQSERNWGDRLDEVYERAAAGEGR